MSFIDLIFQIAKTHPGHLAIKIGDQDITYQAFYQRINSIAAKLGKDQRILVESTYDLNCYASIIAIWITGNTYVPTSTKEIPNVIDRLKPDLLLTPNKESYTITSLNPAECTSAQIIEPVFNSTATAYILSTSGTTGVPKDIPISYSNLDGFVDSFLDLNCRLSDEDSFLQMAELKYDMSIISFLIPLSIGAAIHTINMDGLRYQEIIKQLTTNQTTVCIVPPSAIRLLAPYFEEINLPNLRYTFFGAEKLDVSLVRQWQKCALNSTTVNLYGPSEGGIFATAFIVNDLNKNPIPIGQSASTLKQK
ncbi:MAG: AMP-binding protein [Flavobacteriales bacterium]|nr:AMP-binding protein [Flavobacteriales bacterium]